MCVCVHRASRSLKFETPSLHLFEGVEYLNAAYLCADFAHTNGEHDDTIDDSPNTNTAFPAPLSVLTEDRGAYSPLPSAADGGAAALGNGDGEDGSRETAATVTSAMHHQQLYIEQAVLRMVDIISNAVLARREHSSDEQQRSTSSTVVAHSNNGHSQSVSTSSTTANAATAEDGDRSGNEPFLEYVRDYLRHTTHANNIELKRLVTQFMHSNPTNGDQ